MSSIQPPTGKAGAKVWPMSEQEADNVVYTGLSKVIEGKPVLRLGGPDIAYEANWRFMSDYYNFTAIGFPAKGKTTNNTEVLGFAFELRHSGTYMSGPSTASRIYKEIIREATQVVPPVYVVSAKRIGAGSNRRSSSTPRMGDTVFSTGTGFFITADGYIVTCAHVVKGAQRVNIKTTTDTLSAVVIRSDEQNDVAILKVEGKFDFFPFISSRGAKLGEKVRTLGFPNPDLQGVEPKLTSGEVNSLTGLRDDPRFFQVSMAVQPGNSGGPLVDEHGSVIGIVTSTLNPLAALRSTGSLPQNVNFAIKSSYGLTLAESIPGILLPEAIVLPATPITENAIVKRMLGATVLVIVY